MSEKFATTLEWRGALEIGQRLANLIPDGISYELTEENNSEVKLVIDVEAESLEELRKIVDDLLTLFSDQDQ